jgi:hypothetical protein
MGIGRITWVVGLLWGAVAFGETQSYTGTDDTFYPVACGSNPTAAYADDGNGQTDPGVLEDPLLGDATFGIQGSANLPLAQALLCSNAELGPLYQEPDQNQPGSESEADIVPDDDPSFTATAPTGTSTLVSLPTIPVDGSPPPAGSAPSNPLGLPIAFSYNSSTASGTSTGSATGTSVSTGTDTSTSTGTDTGTGSSVSTSTSVDSGTQTSSSVGTK